MFIFNPRKKTQSKPLFPRLAAVARIATEELVGSRGQQLSPIPQIPARFEEERSSLIALGLEPDEIAYLAADPSAAEICFLITELREGRIIHIIGEGREAFERATTTGRREHESISVSHIHKVLAARATAA